MEHTRETREKPTARPAGDPPVSRRTVLVVEDDPTIADAVATRLRAEGLRVELAVDGPGAVRLAREIRPDLIVLDLMLPGFDGLEVCRRVQADRPVCVLMLTARTDETDLLVGLGVGADDYMTKPFSMRELAARVQALLRRVDRAAELARDSASEVLQLDGLELDQAQRRVWVRRGSERQEVHLTPTEHDLLVCLASRPRAVLSREELLSQVWGWTDASGTRTVDSHVKSLRRKIGPERIRTVHGVGYALQLPG
ncbi:response regulator transcription factor [Allostreptomyces psammosilenae]|uniref:DNA-binding response OmpR family regulator n=1 Tax=Allostreptomyces psammosilenae TaxID=1892865 RepID=A0A852ZWJ3_9ACTN|nr:response regulator transcription factor [Allostreptomyces psammosilenae]NYI06335.1 DNA-binding response OmpR family regulator [Allostreptomyces psammosilenae]